MGYFFNMSDVQYVQYWTKYVQYWTNTAISASSNLKAGFHTKIGQNLISNNMGLQIEWSANEELSVKYLLTVKQ